MCVCAVVIIYQGLSMCVCTLMMNAVNVTADLWSFQSPSGELHGRREGGNEGRDGRRALCERSGSCDDYARGGGGCGC